jgi:hypothetical protein
MKKGILIFCMIISVRLHAGDQENSGYCTSQSRRPNLPPMTGQQLRNRALECVSPDGIIRTTPNHVLTRGHTVHDSHSFSSPEPKEAPITCKEKSINVCKSLCSQLYDCFLTDSDSESDSGPNSEPQSHYSDDSDDEGCFNL